MLVEPLRQRGDVRLATDQRIAQLLNRFHRFSAFGQDFAHAGADASQACFRANHLGRVIMNFGLNDLLDAIVVAWLGSGTAWVLFSIVVGAA